MDITYSGQIQYNFLPDAGWEGERLTYEVPWRDTEDRSQILVPHQHIGFLDIHVSLERNFFWGKIQEVQVHLSYESPDSDWKKQKVLYFYSGEKETEKHWKLRLNTPTDNPAFSYTLVYRMEDGSTKTTEQVTSVVPGVAVPDLTSRKLDVSIVPQLDPTVDKWAFLDVSYEDPDNHYTWEKSLRMASSSNELVDWQIPLMDAKKPEFQYALTFIRANNEKFKKTFPKARYNRIFVESFRMSELKVQLIPKDIDWDAVRLVTVELLYQDTTNNIHESSRQTFKKYDEPFVWKVQTADPSLMTYQWRATFYMRDPALGHGGRDLLPDISGGLGIDLDKVSFSGQISTQE